MTDPKTKYIEDERVSLDDVYVVCDYGYHGEPGSDGYVYFSKETAQAVVDQSKKNYPKLRKIVMDLQSYLWENRRYQNHQCEIC